MLLPFTKAEALGNDFVILEESGVNTADFSKLSLSIADRKRGIGCDQVIWVSDIEPDIRLRFFNADGSEAESCGNGSRACGLLLMDRFGVNTIALHTKGGTVTVNRVDGAPVGDQMPVELVVDRPVVTPLSVDQLPELDGVPLRIPPYHVMAGNPHLILFVEKGASVAELAERYGAALESAALFPDRINVTFAAMVGDGVFEAAVYERGAGLTDACGTAAIATAAAQHAGLGTNRIEVRQKGGSLYMKISDHIISQVGNVHIVFKGMYL